MALQTGMNNETLKRRNRGLILKLIATGEGPSRVELAKQTGLSKMSVSNVISEFIAADIVEERPPLSVQGQGRNPIGLRLSSKAPKLLGLYIYRDICVAVLCDLQLQILKECRLEIHQANADTLETLLYQALDQVLPPPGQRVLGIGVGSIGPLDIVQGVILNPPEFFDIQNFPVVSLLSRRYGLPVYLDAQYNCAALAEKYFGAGRLYQDFMFVGITGGIGSGIVSEGCVLRNASGLTSEVGHVSIDWRGRLCSCGNRGCLEAYASTRLVTARLQKATGLSLDFPGFCRLAEEREQPAIHDIFSEMMDALACAFTSQINLFNPQAILIGHDGYDLPQRCLAQLEARINQSRLVQGRPAIKVLKSTFGTQTQVKSSPCCLLSHVFEGDFEPFLPV